MSELQSRLTQHHPEVVIHRRSTILLKRIDLTIQLAWIYGW
jgi:hypothetical protein